MDANLKEYILKLHNERRNELALGNMSKYKTASKMPALVTFHVKIESEQILCKKCRCILAMGH